MILKMKIIRSDIPMMSLSKHKCMYTAVVYMIYSNIVVKVHETSCNFVIVPYVECTNIVTHYTKGKAADKHYTQTANKETE